MAYRIRVLPQKLDMDARDGDNLLDLLRAAGLPVSAPCGGEGRCGKCRVNVEGSEVLACRTTVERDMVVTLPDLQNLRLAGALPPPGGGRFLHGGVRTLRHPGLP